MPTRSAPRARFGAGSPTFFSISASTCERHRAWIHGARGRGSRDGSKPPDAREVHAPSPHRRRGSHQLAGGGPAARLGSMKVLSGRERDDITLRIDNFSAGFKMSRRRHPRVRRPNLATGCSYLSSEQ
jgi:hypothetical protein